MDQVFPHANVVAGVLVLIVGFGFHFIGQLYWIAMQQIDFKLSGSTFLGDPVNFKSLSLSKIVNVINHRSEFINCRH